MCGHECCCSSRRLSRASSCSYCEKCDECGKNITNWQMDAHLLYCHNVARDRVLLPLKQLGIFGVELAGAA